MLKLNFSKLLAINVRNLSIAKSLFASTNVLTESKDNFAANETQKSETVRKLRKSKFVVVVIKKILQFTYIFIILGPTIAAVFASLSENENVKLLQADQINLDEVILNAKTVNGLLNISETHKDVILRKHALKIVSILAEWTSMERANLSEFENDARFTKLCRMLGRAVKNPPHESNIINNSNGYDKKNGGKFRTSDLETVLGVKSDDEAAKLIASITLSQMVKVMKNLGMKGRRSTPLLRSLAFYMSGKEEHLNVKECSDVLYAMASLNFPEPVLISKLCDDIQIDLKNSEIKKSSTIGSMLTSFSYLKYRDPVVLDCLAEWVINNQSICRTQDIAALVMTLAALNYLPVDCEEALKTKLAPVLTSLDFKSSTEYLTFVWSLMALNIHHDSAFDLVLSQDFLEKLEADFKGEIPTPAKLKLLNINSGVKLFMPSYKGSMLMRDKHQNIYDVPLLHNHEKQNLTKAMIDALKSIVPEACLKVNQDTNMGFVIGN